MLKLVVVCALVVICSVSPNSAKPNMRCVDCNGCQIGDDCVAYDPSGRSGPPDVKTCKEWGIDCSGGEDDSTMRCVDCNGCQIGDDCVGYDPSAISGPPDVKTCKLLGIDCSGGADDSSDDMKAARSLGGCQTCPTQCPTWPNCTLQDYGITASTEESEPAPR